MLRTAGSRELFILGAVALVFGVIAAVWPLSTMLAMVTVWGVYALVDGVIMVVHAFRGRRGRWLALAIGALGIVAGLVAIVHPLSSAAALAWVLGVWLIARGVVQIIEAFGHRAAGPKWLIVLAGVAYLVAGIVVVSNSGAAAVAFSLWIGVLAIMWGVLLIGAGFALRRRPTEAVAR